MKTLFIEAQSKTKVTIPDILLAELPKHTGLVTTVQYAGQIPAIKKTLEAHGKKAHTAKTFSHEAQILGCDTTAAEKIAGKSDAFLYIGTGNFHPMMVALKTKKEVIRFNPETMVHGIVDQKEIEKIEKRKKGALLAFLSAQNIGILVSTKPGQNRLEDATTLKKKLEKAGHRAFLLLFDTLDFSQLENFNFIDCFVNTACPRMAIDDAEKFPKPTVNLEDIQ